MAKTLLLHAGYPKTGTTTLQKGLFATAPDTCFLGKRQGGADMLEGFRDRCVLELRNLVNAATTAHLEARREAIAAHLCELMETAPERLFVLSAEGFTNPLVDTHYLQPKDIARKAEHLARALGPVRAAGHYGALFGAENVHLIDTGALFAGADGAHARLAAISPELEAQVRAGLELPRLNVRRGGGRAAKRFRLVTRSPAARASPHGLGPLLEARALGPAGRLRRVLGRPVSAVLPDRSERIRAYYAASNAALAREHAIRLD